MAGPERFHSALEDAGDRIVAGRAMDGDVDAFAVLVRRYTPMMRAYTQRMLNASADVDDIVQETFVTAWQRFPELEDPGKVKSWLMRIASHKAVDRIRRIRPTVDVDEVDRPAPLHASPSAIVEVREGVAALGAALRELPETQRECWVLREMAGYTYGEIAEELDLPLTTVRGMLARARSSLITRMEAWR
jgi:RNA polymerase sigma-70 factor (ECF subfamily)